MCVYGDMFVCLPYVQDANCKIPTSKFNPQVFEEDCVPCKLPATTDEGL